SRPAAPGRRVVVRRLPLFPLDAAGLRAPRLAGGADPPRVAAHGGGRLEPAGGLAGPLGAEAGAPQRGVVPNPCWKTGRGNAREASQGARQLRRGHPCRGARGARARGVGPAVGVRRGGVGGVVGGATGVRRMTARSAVSYQLSAVSCQLSAANITDG